MSVTANVSNISRASLHDGPGVRTVVYLKGCALHCRWCHNPETLSAQPDILFAPVKCIGCGRCVEVCPDCHRIEGEKLVLVREACTHCGKCADRCPTGALSLSGSEMTLAELKKQVEKDRHYYETSGGGVTLSGGECLLQAEFCAEFLRSCKESGIHTVVETALFVPWENVERVVPYCDFFFADFKIPDAEKHREYTGERNDRILENLRRLARLAPGKITLRIPLIPGVNDSSEDLAGFAHEILPLADAIAGVEVLKYNALAKSKYALAGKEYTDFGEAQTNEAMLTFCNALEEALAHKTKVFTVTT